MPTREDELVRDSERTRADLASDLEALGDRVAPKKVVARGKAKATEKVEELGEQVSPRRMLKRPSKTSTVARPVVAGVVVVGAGVLIARLMRSRAQDEASEAGGGVVGGRPRSGREGEPEPESRARKAPAQAEQGVGTSSQRARRPATGGVSTTVRARRTAAMDRAPTATKAGSGAAGAARKAPARAAGTAKQSKAQAQGRRGP